MGKRVDIEMNNEPGRTTVGSETLLVVEDNTLVRQLMTRVLRNHGFNVLEASNGLEALRLAQENSTQVIGLLIANIGMPLMGGEELAQRFLLLRPEIKVLFTSGNTDAAILYDDDTQPPINYLQKPFSPDDLVSLVRQTLQS